MPTPKPLISRITPRDPLQASFVNRISFVAADDTTQPDRAELILCMGSVKPHLIAPNEAKTPRWLAQVATSQRYKNTPTRKIEAAAERLINKKPLPECESGSGGGLFVLHQNGLRRFDPVLAALAPLRYKEIITKI